MSSFEGVLHYAPADLVQREALFELLYSQYQRDERQTPPASAAKRRWDELRTWFVSTGEIYRILVGKTCAGLLWTEQQGHRLYLHDLVLFPDFRSRGIAGRVVRDLETSYAEASDEIEIGVKVTNKQARAVFAQLGFQVSRVAGEMDYLILRKPLH
ncbi:GNAT family N-acetyltransferase [Candidatus Bipolaricaulota bacterium]|nr:GNAT family N-acetyltransferase [Candidatus Bipolaricaulota bacterium]